MGVHDLAYLAGVAPYRRLRQGLRSLNSLGSHGSQGAQPPPSDKPIPAAQESAHIGERAWPSGGRAGQGVDSNNKPSSSAEVRLEPTAALLSGLSEALQVCMLSIDASDRIVFVNQHLCTTFGLMDKEKELIQAPASTLYNDIARLTTDPTRTAQAMLDASRAPDLPTSIGLTLTDGRRFEATCATVTQEASSRFWFFRPQEGSPQPSDSEAGRLHLARLYDRRTAMLSTASHEVRGTLHGIMGLVDELRYAPLAVPDPELLEVLGDACSGLRSLVQQVLDLARRDTDAVTLTHETFDLRAVLRHVGTVVAGVLRGTEVGLDLSLDPQCYPWRMGDVGCVSQILTNVATNAARCSEQGKVTISVTPTGTEMIRFVVSDSGPGMPQFAQDRLTNPTSRSAVHDGDASLGLLIARELIELLEGSVDVTASSGSGTTVDIAIPLPETPRPEIGLAEEQRTALFDRALVVDDAPEGLDFIRRALQPAGGQIDSTGDTSLALHWAESNTYDVVILDGMMSPHDGADITRAIRQMETSREITIIVATADVGTASSARYLAAGADLVLLKPFAKTQLIESLRRLRPTSQPVVTSPSAPEHDSLQVQALQMFAGAIDARMVAIRAALANRDPDRAAPALHALASPAMVVGATRTGEYGLALETVTRSVGLAGLSVAAIDQLENMARSEVSELLSSLSTPTQAVGRVSRYPDSRTV